MRVAAEKNVLFLEGNLRFKRDPYQNGTLSYTSDELPIPFTIPEVSATPHNPDGCVLIYPQIEWRGWCCSCNNQMAICEIAQN